MDKDSTNPPPDLSDMPEMLTEALQALHNLRSSHNRDSYWCFTCNASIVPELWSRASKMVSWSQ